MTCLKVVIFGRDMANVCHGLFIDFCHGMTTTVYHAFVIEYHQWLVVDIILGHWFVTWALIILVWSSGRNGF
jgi:hypothetical protein